MMFKSASSWLSILGSKKYRDTNNFQMNVIGGTKWKHEKVAENMDYN